MLVLSRQVSEQLIIDGRVRVTVTALSNGRVRLGIAAPDDVPVRRGEVAGRPPVARLHTGTGLRPDCRGPDDAPE